MTQLITLPLAHACREITTRQLLATYILSGSGPQTHHQTYRRVGYEEVVFV